MGEGGVVRTLFRVVVVLHAAMALAQPVAAGAILQASTLGLAVHQAVGGVLLLVAFVQVPVAVLAWRPGRLPAWPVAVSLGLVVVETAQVALGPTACMPCTYPRAVRK
jgi:hypothetical protein